MSEDKGKEQSEPHADAAQHQREVVEDLQPLQAGPEEIFWLEFDKELKKGSITKVEDAAKQLITVTSIVQTIYFAAVSFSETKKVLGLIPPPVNIWFIFLLFFPLILWAASLYHSINAFMPKTYLMNEISPDMIEETYMEILKYKSGTLNHAYRLLCIGFAVAFVTLFIYLVLVPTVPSAK